MEVQGSQFVWRGHSCPRTVDAKENLRGHRPFFLEQDGLGILNAIALC